MFSLQQEREECRKAVEIIRNKVHSKLKKQKQILTTLTIMSKDNLGGKLPIRHQNTHARCRLVRRSKAGHKCFKYSPKISILNLQQDIIRITYGILQSLLYCNSYLNNLQPQPCPKCATKYGTVTTVPPAKSDSHALSTMSPGNHVCINPIRRIGLIYK